MSKYEPLARFLSQLSEDSATLGFERINEILGSKLPQSAYDHRPWWANRHDGRDAQNLGWQSVGWEAKDVDMRRKHVTFLRVGKNRPEFGRPDTKEIASVKALTIDEAKRGLAAYFQVDPSTISITISA